ncbi:MAG: hypothetical protein M1832_002743 [Thelocarpon impressellum]|nr:MAG: hypothetical protein M1832_002743 [Thelocarpon impressellum]
MAANNPSLVASLLSGSEFVDCPSKAAAVAAAVLDDCLQNILHDIVAEVHHDEKVLRGESAIIIAEEEAKKANGAEETSPTSEARDPITTPGAVVEYGKASLRGNPLETTKDIICPRCRLPRLLHPTTDNAGDPAKTFCARHPPSDKPGLDIWGNPFASSSVAGAKTKKDKKEKEGAGKKNGAVDSPAASPPPASDAKAAANFPSVKCPNCPRYLVVTRVAAHLEKCLGLFGRSASRNAKAKMDQGRNSSTPHGSRLGTPAAAGPGERSSPAKRAREADDDDDDEVVETPKKKKVMKKAVEKVGAAAAAAAAAAAVAKLKKSKPPAAGPTEKASKKRGREDEGGEDEVEKEEVRPKKAKGVAGLVKGAKPEGVRPEGVRPPPPAVEV